jgi:hypothetical protein
MTFDEWYERNRTELTDNLYACKLSWYSSRSYISIEELKHMMHSALRHKPLSELSDGDRRILDLLSSHTESNKITSEHN